MEEPAAIGGSYSQSAQIFNNTTGAVPLNHRVPHGVLKSLSLMVYNSRFTRSLVFSALAVSALCAAYSALNVFGNLYDIHWALNIGMPSPWLIAAVGVSGYVVGLLIQISEKKGWQKLEFEISNFARLFSKNYNEICVVKDEESHVKGKIFLGALPNKLTRDASSLVAQENIKAVLSINEDWELEPMGCSIPEDWEGLGITYKTMSSQDHQPLNKDQLEHAAEFIHQQIETGKNVYVHCRAGRGRSAMAVAAYLMKYCSEEQNGINAQRAAAIIKKHRPITTIDNKIADLEKLQSSPQAE